MHIMTMSTWLVFLLASLVTTFSPGPGVLLAISTSASVGVRRTAYSSAGNALGVVVVATTAAAGVGMLLQTSAVAFAALKALGAGYLVYLGVRQWRRRAAPLQPAAAGAATVATRRGLFLRGLLVALTNPKSILFFSAVFPQFMHDNEPALFALLISTFVACTLLSHLCYALLARAIGKRAMGASRARLANRAGGAVFIGLGCSLLGLSARPA
ncbi:homoserine/homoserine lactone efflux protein [Janthinobacterium sp. CG_23.3]